MLAVQAKLILLNDISYVDKSVRPRLDKYTIRREDCWEWIGAKDSFGYGFLKISRDGEKFNLGSHIIQYILSNGVVPAANVCHSCDNPSCVNPAHLWEGTTAENNRDCFDKGRHSKGKQQTIAVSSISEDVAKQILLTNEPGRESSKRFGVSEAAVSLIRSGKRWSYLQKGLNLLGRVA